jgi:hypothetical protein
MNRPLLQISLGSIQGRAWTAEVARIEGRIMMNKENKPDQN